MTACTAAQLICQLRLSLPREQVTLTVTADQLAWMGPRVAEALLPGQTATLTITAAQAQRMADRLFDAMRRRA